VVRCDLLADLLNADLLKSYPLRGWQIVLGELLTPVVILSIVMWLALLAFGMAQLRMPWLMGSAIAGLALLAPALVALQLLIPNGVAILLPAWSQSVRTEQGLEVLGQRLIFMLLQLVVMILLLLPAAVGAVAVWFAASLLLGATPLGAGLAAVTGTLAVLLTELGVVIFWLGNRFESLDISAELRP
jgi:ABC-2 type transport system permease protein